jgi:hypothetical protein
MNLREYAAHRKQRGLSGTTKVAVFYAAKNGRLPGSARLIGGNWEIDADLADVEWELNKRNPSMRLTAKGETMTAATTSKEDVSGPIPDLGNLWATRLLEPLGTPKCSG